VCRVGGTVGFLVSSFLLAVSGRKHLYSFPESELVYQLGWVFAMAKSVFAGTVEKLVKTDKNWQ